METSCSHVSRLLSASFHHLSHPKISPLESSIVIRLPIPVQQEIQQCGEYHFLGFGAWYAGWLIGTDTGTFGFQRI